MPSFFETIRAGSFLNVPAELEPHRGHPRMGPLAPLGHWRILIGRANDFLKPPSLALLNMVRFQDSMEIDEAPRSKLRGILRNSQKPLPSFANATERSPRLHPRSGLLRRSSRFGCEGWKLRGIRRRRIK